MGLQARIGATWLGFDLRGWNLGLEARFWPSRLEFEYGGWVLSFEGWNLSFEARFGALRLNLRLEGVDGEEGGKISPMCESIGHQPLRGRCPKRKFEI